MKLVSYASISTIAIVIFFGQWLTSILLGAVACLLLVVGGLCIRFIYANIYMRVPEHSAFIIYNRRHKAFERLLWPHQSRQFIHPLWESVTGELSTRPISTSSTAVDVHANDRIPLSVSYKVTFQVAPKETSRELLSRLLPAFLKNPEGLLATHAEDCLRDVFGTHDASYICSGEHHAQLAQAVQAALQQRVKPLGLTIYRVILGAIKPPVSYQKQINEAQERKVKADAEAAVLQSQAKALELIAKDENVQTLWVWLEQLRTMEKNGMVVPALLPLLNGYTTPQKADKGQNHAQDQQAPRAPLTSGKSPNEDGHRQVSIWPSTPSPRPTPSPWEH